MPRIVTKAELHRTALRALAPDETPAYLSRHSGLPGPRGNLELLAAFGDVADPGLIMTLATDSPDEYLRSCGTAALGRLILDGTGPARHVLIATLRARAGDLSWRVREAVAMALQRVGDGDPETLRRLVAVWVGDPSPLVRRAAIAGICEPRLLRSQATATAALAACDVASASLAATPVSVRRDPGLRTLRQALGYCWSVAVAGDPRDGLAAFARLTDSEDPDIAWIVRENRKKARLARLLADTEGTVLT